jgi:hypothetical protein
MGYIVWEMRQSSKNERKIMKHETYEVFVHEIVMPKEVTMGLGSKEFPNLQTKNSRILKSEEERMKIVLQKLNIKKKPKCLHYNINFLNSALSFFGMIIRRGEWCCSNLYIALYNNQRTLQIQ